MTQDPGLVTSTDEEPRYVSLTRVRELLVTAGYSPDVRIFVTYEDQIDEKAPATPWSLDVQTGLTRHAFIESALYGPEQYPDGPETILGYVVIAINNDGLIKLHYIAEPGEPSLNEDEEIIGHFYFNPELKIGRIAVVCREENFPKSEGMKPLDYVEKHQNTGDSRLMSALLFALASDKTYW